MSFYFQRDDEEQPTSFFRPERRRLIVRADKQ